MQKLFAIAMCALVLFGCDKLKDSNATTWHQGNYVYFEDTQTFRVYFQGSMGHEGYTDDFVNDARLYVNNKRVLPYYANPNGYALMQFQYTESVSRNFIFGEVFEVEYVSWDGNDSFVDYVRVPSTGPWQKYSFQYDYTSSAPAQDYFCQKSDVNTRYSVYRCIK